MSKSALALAHHDFETFSPVDLRSAGADVYAAHADAEVLCMAWELPGDKSPEVWKPGDKDPTRFLDWIEDGGATGAFNSYFEWTVWELIVSRQCPHWPRPRLEQYHDVMAWANAAALPGSLEDLAKALGMSQRKDVEGAKIMKQLTKPRKWTGDTYTRWTREEHPEKFELLYKYCAQDVIVERDAAKRLRPLSAQERKVWLLDQKINKRGIRLDVEAIARAKDTVTVEAKRINREMFELTGGKVSAVTKLADLKDWLAGLGVECPEGLAADQVRDLLADPSTPAKARAALRLRKEGGKASTAKLGKMLKQASTDGRARGQYTYHGPTTGRWAARGIQVQNLKRPLISAREVQECIELFGDEDGADLIRFGYLDPLDAVSSSLRGMLITTAGCRWLGGDFANIEGRVLAWIAGEIWKLDAFVDYDTPFIDADGHKIFNKKGEYERIGPDLYKMAYSRAFGIEPKAVSSDQRQIGKVMELALGYQGGVGAFRSMAAAYNANLETIAAQVLSVADDDTKAKAEKKRLWLQVEHKMHVDLAPDTYRGVRILVDAWREAHPMTKGLWADVEGCAMSAVKYRGEVFTIKSGLVSFVCSKDFLYCKLPSGRILSYARPSLVWVKNKFTGEDQQVLQYWAEGKDRDKTGGKKKFEPFQSYGGVLTENIVQAAARDVQAEAMLRVDKAGFSIVLHTHDEIRAEVPHGVSSPHEFEKIMATPPVWAGGLPIAVECEEMVRYHK